MHHQYKIKVVKIFIDDDSYDSKTSVKGTVFFRQVKSGFWLCENGHLWCKTAPVWKLLSLYFRLHGVRPNTSLTQCQFFSVFCSVFMQLSCTTWVGQILLTPVNAPSYALPKKQRKRCSQNAKVFSNKENKKTLQIPLFVHPHSHKMLKLVFQPTIDTTDHEAKRSTAKEV